MAQSHYFLKKVIFDGDNGAGKWRGAKARQSDSICVLTVRGLTRRKLVYFVPSHYFPAKRRNSFCLVFDFSLPKIMFPGF